MENNLYKSGCFLAANHTYEDAKGIIFGAPMDFTVSFRPGTRFGPEKIRNVSIVLEEYSPYLNKSLDEVLFYDAGDLNLPFGNVEKSLKIIHDYSLKVQKDGKLPILLGGEHLITLPAVQAAFKVYKNLKVIQFDAHADLREDYEGEVNSHASVIRKITELIDGANVFQLGIRSGTKDEFDFGRKNTNFYFDQVTEPLSQIIQDCSNAPVYITVDIDVLDPACAPGTGTPEPGGMLVKEMQYALNKLSNLNVVGFDVVEVSPPYDHSDITAIAAAKLVREAILGFI